MGRMYIIFTTCIRLEPLQRGTGYNGITKTILLDVPQGLFRWIAEPRGQTYTSYGKVPITYVHEVEKLTDSGFC